jgi:adenosylhomocysteine nucleosidase
MKQCPAIIAALPREVGPLVKGWDRRQLPGRVIVYTNGDAVVACAGMGAARAALAVEAAMAAMPVTALISVGLAGACDPSVRIGEIVRAGVVIDSQTGEQYDNLQFRQVLVSAPAIASVQEKTRLHSSYYATAVDMEAATVARLARAYDLYFSAIKAISDAADFEMEGLSRFATADGQFREGSFALHMALRPQLWEKAIALGRNSSKALDALTVVLRGELDWYKTRA